MSAFQAVTLLALREERATAQGQELTLGDAAEALWDFVAGTQFRLRVFHLGGKLRRGVPQTFAREWSDFERHWDWPLWIAGLDCSRRDWIEEERPSIEEPELFEPDPSITDELNPIYQDWGAAVEIALSYMKRAAASRDQQRGDDAWREANVCRLGVDAFRYLRQVIGLNVADVLRRWRRVPVIFFPEHREPDRGDHLGTLDDLLDDAVRSYVCGAPAAAIAMCRASLERVLKEQYGRGRWDKARLAELISLASAEFSFIEEARVRRLVDRANGILHRYSREHRLTASDDRLIVEFLKTVKFLVQRAPGD